MAQDIETFVASGDVCGRGCVGACMYECVCAGARIVKPQWMHKQRQILPAAHVEGWIVSSMALRNGS